MSKLRHCRRPRYFAGRVPRVNCRGAEARNASRRSRVTLEEALEINRREAREAAGDGFEEIPIAV
jgi:hypothetical protein